MSHLKTVSADLHGAKQKSGEKSSPRSPFFCLFHFAGTYFSLKRKVKNGCVCENAADPVFSLLKTAPKRKKAKVAQNVRADLSNRCQLKLLKGA